MDQEISQEEFEQKIESALKQAQQFALIPILRLIYYTTNNDYGYKYNINDSILADNLKTSEIEIINNQDSTKKFKFYLDIVDKDYNLDFKLNELKVLSPEANSLINEPNKNLKDQLINIITYLTQTAKIIFDNIKENNTELLEYNIQLDNNTTIFLDPNSNYRLGINIIEF
jgi:hypothetical protein